MAGRRSNRAERRSQIERLLVGDHTRSDRSIARAVGSSHSSVGTVRGELVAAGRIDRRPDRLAADAQGESGRSANLVRARAGEPGPALRHGAESENRLAPLRMRFESSLRHEFDVGVLDDRRLSLLADLLARIEMARRWLDSKGTVVRNRSGEAWPVVASLEAWSRRADALLTQLHQAGADGGAGRQTLADVESELPDEVFEDVVPVAGGDGEVGT